MIFESPPCLLCHLDNLHPQLTQPGHVRFLACFDDAGRLNFLSKSKGKLLGPVQIHDRCNTLNT